MIYELAKKLKENGYPQKPYGKGEWFADIEPKIVKIGNFHSDSLRNHADVSMRISNDDLIYMPTLEELIEACPKKYKLVDSLSEGNFVLSTDGEKWGAGYTVQDELEPCRKDLWKPQVANIPTEAVAYLWLALNEK